MKYIYIDAQTELTLNATGILMAKLFERFNIDYCMIVESYEPALTFQLTQLGISAKRVINIYDYFQGVSDSDSLNFNYIDLGVAANPVALPNNGKVSLMRQNKSIGQLESYSENLSRPKQMQVETEHGMEKFSYDVRGFLSSIDRYNLEQVWQSRVFLSALGEIVLTQTKRGFCFQGEKVQYQKEDLLTLFLNSEQEKLAITHFFTDTDMLPSALEQVPPFQKFTAVSEQLASLRVGSHLYLRANDLIWPEQIDSDSMQQRANNILVYLNGHETELVLENIVAGLELLLKRGQIIVRLFMTSANNEQVTECLRLLKDKKIKTAIIKFDADEVVSAQFQHARLLVQSGSAILPRVLQGMLATGLPTIMLGDQSEINLKRQTYLTDVFELGTELTRYQQKLDRLIFDLNYWNQAHKRCQIDLEMHNQKVQNIWLQQLLD